MNVSSKSNSTVITSPSSQEVRMNKNEKALKAFNQFLTRFPESKFAPSVRKSLVTLEANSFENLIYTQDKRKKATSQESNL